METTETFESLVRAEFTPKSTYLNTASNGLLPARTVAALHEAALLRAEGRPLTSLYEDVEASRAAYARLAGVPASRVAVGASVAAHSGVIAASLPAGAEVLTAEDDFTSVLNPFHVRGDLKVRSVPLERIAESVRPGTALVAVSAAQSADGRVADLPALREAARDHGARTYVDFSQSAGWLPMDADAHDFSASVSFKWLLGPHGTAFLVVPEDFGGLTPLLAGWVAGERPWDSCYGPVSELAHSARRFDLTRPVHLRGTAPLPRSRRGTRGGRRARPRRGPRRPVPGRTRRARPPAAALARFGDRLGARTRRPPERVEPRRHRGLRPGGQPAGRLPPVQHGRGRGPAAGRARRLTDTRTAGPGPRPTGDPGPAGQGEFTARA